MVGNTPRFHVAAYIHGLGENEGIRKLFVGRANESWDALQKDAPPAVHHMMK